MASTSGTIRKLPSGKYQVRITDPSAKQISIGTFTSKAIANAELHEAMADLNKPSIPESHAPPIHAQAHLQASKSSKYLPTGYPCHSKCNKAPKESLDFLTAMASARHTVHTVEFPWWDNCPALMSTKVIHEWPKFPPNI